MTSPATAARRSRTGSLALAAAVLALGACDLVESSGPGVIPARVSGSPALGAAVLDVTWRDVEGFSGRGTTQVYWAPVAGFPDRYRVVLVGATGGDLLFDVDISDVRAERPTITVVSAADTADEVVSPGGLRVSIDG